MTQVKKWFLEGWIASVRVVNCATLQRWIN